MRTQEHDPTDNDEDDVSFPAGGNDSNSEYNRCEGPTLLSVQPKNLPLLPKNKVFKVAPKEIPLFTHRLLKGPETTAFQNYMNQRKRKDNFQQASSALSTSNQKRIKKNIDHEEDHYLPKDSGKLEEQVDSHMDSDIFRIFLFS